MNGMLPYSLLSQRLLLSEHPTHACLWGKYDIAIEKLYGLKCNVRGDVMTIQLGCIATEMTITRLKYPPLIYCTTCIGLCYE